MKFLRFVFLTSVLLLTTFLYMGAQNTVPSTVDSEILDPAGRLVYAVPGYLQWENHDNLVRYLQTDTDSINSSLDATDIERRWKITIVRITASYAYVMVRTMDPVGYPWIASYDDSLAINATAEMPNEDFLPGIDILMDDTNTSGIAVGDEIEIVFLRRSLDPHHLSRLTVASAWRDSFIDDSDTTYGLAVPGNIENMTWFFRSITSSDGDAHGDNVLGLGYQLKIIGEAWGLIYAVSDSFYLPQNTIKDTTFEHGVADSLRTVHWGMATTTKLYLNFIKWLGGN